MDKGQIDALEESNMNLSIVNKEQRERIDNLERTNELQWDALKVSHDLNDDIKSDLRWKARQLKESDRAFLELEKELQMLQT